MDETTKQETKTKTCHCPVVLGALVIVFAWWPVSWGAIALTILGAVIILKDLIGGQCCCTKFCKPKTGN